MGYFLVNEQTAKSDYSAEIYSYSGEMIENNIQIFLSVSLIVLKLANFFRK